MTYASNLEPTAASLSRQSIISKLRHVNLFNELAYSGLRAECAF